MAYSLSLVGTGDLVARKGLLFLSLSFNLPCGRDQRTFALLSVFFWLDLGLIIPSEALIG